MRALPDRPVRSGASSRQILLSAPGRPEILVDSISFDDDDGPARSSHDSGQVDVPDRAVGPRGRGPSMRGPLGPVISIVLVIGLGTLTAHTWPAAIGGITAICAVLASLLWVLNSQGRTIRLERLIHAIRGVTKGEHETQSSDADDDKTGYLGGYWKTGCLLCSAKISPSQGRQTPKFRRAACHV